MCHIDWKLNIFSWTDFFTFKHNFTKFKCMHHMALLDHNFLNIMFKMHTFETWHRNITCSIVSFDILKCVTHGKSRHFVQTLPLLNGISPCSKHTVIARFKWPTWGPSGAYRTRVGPMLAPWTLLSGQTFGTWYNWFHCLSCYIEVLYIYILSVHIF